MLPVTLRRSLAAGGLALGLVVLPVAGPLAGAQTAPTQRSCGSAGPPLCDLIDQLEVALAPLEPLFALGLPVVGELGNAVHGLQSTLEQVVGDPEAVDVQDALAQLRGVFTLVGSVTGPLLEPLGLAGLGSLPTLLAQIESALESQLAGASASETVAAATPSTVPRSVYLPAPRSRAAGASPTVAIPAVPEGAPLDLPDLELPDLGAAVADAFDLGSGDGVSALPDLPTPELADPLDTTNDAAAAAAALAVSGMLVTGALLAARARARRTPVAE